MRYSRWTAIFSGLLCLASFQAPAEEASFERLYLKMMLVDCIAPVEAQEEDLAAFAKERGMIEFPAKQAAAFDKTGGRVFAPLNAMGNMVLIVHKSNVGCSLSARTLDAKSFWGLTDEFFGPASPFKKISDKTTTQDRRQEYQGDLNGPVTLLISARNAAKDGSPQAVMTLSRYDE